MKWSPLGMRATSWIVTLALFPVFLVAAEWTLWKFRTEGPSRTDTVQKDYMPLALRPNFEGIVGGQGISTNRFGFRGSTDLQIPKPASQSRILVLGDSITFGFGVAMAQTYCQSTQERLDRRIPSCLVINGAGQGYSPSSYAAYLEAEGWSVEPDVVVVQIEPSNDVTDEALLRTEGNRIGRVRGGRYLVAWDGNLLGSVSLGPYWYERTYLYTYLTRRFLTSLDSAFPDRSPLSRSGIDYFHLGFDRPLLTARRIDRGWQNLFIAIGEIQRLCALKNAELVLFVSPTAAAFDPSSPSHRFANRIVDRALRWATSQRIRSLDAREALSRGGGGALYSDFAHFDHRGHSIVGQAMADLLASQVLAGTDR